MLTNNITLGELISSVYEACLECYGDSELAGVAAELTLHEILNRDDRIEKRLDLVA